MLLKFFQSLLSNKYWLILFLVLTQNLSADELSNTPGVLESFQTLIKVSNQRESNAQKSYQGKDVITSSSELKLEKFKYTIDHTFIQTTLMKANRSYFDIKRDQTCDFLEQLWFGLFSKKPGKRIKVLAYKEDKVTGFKEKVIVSSKVMAEALALDSCPESISLFRTIKRSSIEQLVSKISLPKNQEYESNLLQCQKVYSSLKQSPYLNYLFYLSKLINYTQRKKNKSSLKNSERLIFLKSKKIQETLNYTQLNIIKGMQYNLRTEKEFCKNHSVKNIYRLVKKNPMEWKNFLTPYCLDILGKSSQLNRNELHQCIDKMQANNLICTKVNNRYTQSLYPRQNCKELIENYNSSSFKKIAPDCPGLLRNEGIINSSRIVSIYDKDYQKPNYVYYDYKNDTRCFKNNIQNINEFSEEFSIENFWGTRACYYNKVQREEVCYKVAFFNDPSVSISVSNVVAQILKESKTTQYKPKCLFVTQGKLSSLGLKKSQGCHITYNQNKCSFDSCEVEVFLNGRKVPKFINIKNRSQLNYFSFKNNSISVGFHRSLKQKYKLKDSKVYNLTQLKEILGRKNVLIHGIGCAEDFLPQFFKRRTINQCKPLPFIISGLKSREKALTDAVLVNLTIDSITDNRSYDWRSINNAVVNYQKTHPTRMWSLYALYQ